MSKAIFNIDWWKTKIHKQDGKNIKIARKVGNKLYLQSGALYEDGTLINTGTEIEFEAGVPTDIDVNSVKTKKLDVRASDSSVMIETDGTNKVTSLYGDVELGSDEVSTDLTVNGDTTTEGLFAKEEIEFEDANGAFGANAIAKIKDAAGVPDGTGHLNKFLRHGTTGNSWESINSAAIDSGLATAGQFLVANGSGGCSWQTIPAANTESF